MLSLLLFALPALAAPDAGVDEIPRCGEHKALIRQAELLRAEANKPRSWHERNKTDKLKEELASVDRVLEEVEMLYGERRAACRARWMDVSEVQDPSVGAHPGFYACASHIWVTDEMVRIARRKESISMQLKDHRLTPSTHEKLKLEMREVEARLDTLLGNPTLYLLPTSVTVDGGIDGVPEGPRNPAAKQ